MSVVHERVDRLEDALERFVVSVGIEFNKLYNSQMRTEAEMRAFKDEMRDFKDEMRVFKDEMSDFKDEMRIFKDEMSDFKDEMRVFKDEMRVFKDEMRIFKDEMSDFKDEMRVFKDEMSVFKNGVNDFKDEMQAQMRDFQGEMRGFKSEMSDFKDEMSKYKEENRQQIREMNRQWGDMSNKLGTMVEDLVYPSLPRIVRETLNREADRIWARIKQRLPDGRVKEFDAIVIAPDLACVNSTKATLRSADVDGFVTDIAAFREFFPEYGHLPAIGILATLAVEDSVLAYAEKMGFLVLAVGDEIMEVKNTFGFEPKRW